MANWVLKFISGKYQGGEFPLEEGQEYFVGRSSESDMVLVEDMVSRQHAKLVIRDDVVKLHDLGSTNGSFVNGERVSDVDLREGDRILFGTSIIKLIRSADASGGASRARAFVPDAREEQPAKQTASLSQGSGVTMAGSMSGMLEEVSLPDLLQLFSTSRKSGVLRLIRDREKASIFLREGRVIYCEIEGVDLPPDKAAYRVMVWERGMFVLEPPSDRKFDVELEISTEGLMMEAMRLLDEMENIKHKLPDAADRVRPMHPIDPPLRSLTPELLDTFQLVLNNDTVGDILNQSLATDLETMQDIEYLIKHKYIEIV
ncbi:MAG: DUF4388 domain-containing protein [Myxococcales bacterium]|nr:DUF4388 domain-containing protein [Myxococcales bacterium]MCB9530976.1 DUF4388 domain-containing protein [Myxococcales bacterium]MCB9532896.1 DUF4388 domain-containing protein [Myxococcales bacterium]